jgi:hypothetical protein
MEALVTFQIEETVLTYRDEQLTAWKGGDKVLMPHFVEMRDIVKNQPSYHFGEAFVLNHYHRQDGWLGFMDYLLMPEVEPNIARHERGRKMLEKLVAPEKLLALRTERRNSVDGRKGYGEPDLFLYKPTGEMMFVEVKKGGDTLKGNQLQCLAQIQKFLGCPTRIVYLQRESTRPRLGKVHSVEL